MKRKYFAYGSNMNQHQMQFRCPEARKIERVILKDYRLVFRGGRRNYGVASIIPEKGSQVEGVLWSITTGCENPALPSNYYLAGILEGGRQNGISEEKVMEAVVHTALEIKNEKTKQQKRTGKSKKKDFPVL